VLQRLQEHFHGTRPPPELGRLCTDQLTPELEELREQSKALGTAAALMGTPGSAMFFAAANPIDRIGPDHKLGDVVADALRAAPRRSSIRSSIR